GDSCPKRASALCKIAPPSRAVPGSGHIARTLAEESDALRSPRAARAYARSGIQRPQKVTAFPQPGVGRPLALTAHAMLLALLHHLALAMRLYTAVPTLTWNDAFAHAAAADAAATPRVSPELLLAIAFVESRFDPT